VNLLNYVRNVLWSFIGLGRRQDFDEVTRTAHPVALIAVALVLAAAFVGVLLLLVQYAAGG
jgi:hypothetical protein